MINNSSSEDEIAIKRELESLEYKLSITIGDTYSKAMERKFLRHRIADLNYMLRNPGVKIS